MIKSLKGGPYKVLSSKELRTITIVRDIVINEMEISEKDFSGECRDWKCTFSRNLYAYFCLQLTNAAQRDIMILTKRKNSSAVKARAYIRTILTTSPDPFYENKRKPLRALVTSTFAKVKVAVIEISGPLTLEDVIYGE